MVALAHRYNGPLLAGHSWRRLATQPRELAFDHILSSSSPLFARFGEFELDEANARLLRGSSALALSPTPFKLLCALARRPGALLTKHALLDEVWGHRFVSDSVLKGAISDVRMVLGDNAQKPRFIETAPRRGYRFIASASAPPLPRHSRWW